MQDFKIACGTIMGEGLTEEQMGLLFMQIDANTDNEVDWDEFSTFILLREERQSKMRDDATIQLFDVPTNMMSFPKFQTRHRDAIVSIIFMQNPSRFITCSREGTVCYWTEKLKLQRLFNGIR